MWLVDAILARSPLADVPRAGHGLAATAVAPDDRGRAAVRSVFFRVVHQTGGIGPAKPPANAPNQPTPHPIPNRSSAKPAAAEPKPAKCPGALGLSGGCWGALALKQPAESCSPRFPLAVRFG